MNNPVSMVDDNGLWAWVVNGHKEAMMSFKTTYNLSSNYSGSKDLTDKINSYSSKWLEKAPNVAKFLSSNDKDKQIRVGVLENLWIGKGSTYPGTRDIGIAESGLKGDMLNFNLEQTAFHEIIHSMGFNEIGAWAAETAMGFTSTTKMLNKILDDPNYYLEGIEGIPELSKYLDEHKRLKKDQTKEFMKAFINYGKRIIGS